jgi:hypothetical protein
MLLEEDSRFVSHRFSYFRTLSNASESIRREVQAVHQDCIPIFAYSDDPTGEWVPSAPLLAQHMII